MTRATEDLNKEIAAQKTEETERQSHIDQLKGQVESLGGEIDEYRGAVDTQKAALNQTKSELESNQGELKQQKDAIVQQNEALQQQKSELRRVNTTIDKQKQELECKEVGIKELEGLNEEAKEALMHERKAQDRMAKQIDYMDATSKKIALNRIEQALLPWIKVH